MEKLIVKAIVILGLTFSYHAMSGTYSACAGSTCNNGTFNSGNASSGNLGAFSPGFVLGSGMGGGPSAADMAKRKAAEEEGKRQAKLKCKAELETELRKTRSMLYEEHQRNTSTCNNYHILAVGSTIVGAVAAIPTFGFTAAAGVSAGASFATAGIICQQNADGRYAELLAHNESVTREFDLKVCENI